MPPPAYFASWERGAESLVTGSVFTYRFTLFIFLGVSFCYGWSRLGFYAICIARAWFFGYITLTMSSCDLDLPLEIEMGEVCDLEYIVCCFDLFIRVEWVFRY